MTSKQFDKAIKLAQSSTDLSTIDDSILFGFGLPDFKKVHLPIEMVAKTLRWQAKMLNGQWDYQELENCRQLMATKVILL